MSLWTRTNPPKFAPHAVPGRDGWVHPLTNETLEVFDTKPTLVTTPTINSVVRAKTFNTESGDPIASTSTHLYVGDTVKFSVQFNSQVIVSGQPYINFVIGLNTRHALYEPKAGFDFGQSVAGTTGGTATLCFYYKITSSDVATAGNVSITSPVQPNGGSIKNYLGAQTNATLTFTPPNLTTLAVN